MNKELLRYSDIFFKTDCLTFDQLVAYKAGKLTKKQNHYVECHLIDCEFCSEALEGVEKIKDIKKSKATIKRVNRKIRKKIYRSENERRLLYKHRYIAIAATFLGIITTLFFIGSNNKADELFAKHFELYPNLIPIVRGETEESLFIHAMQAYETGHFLQAEWIFKQVSETDDKYLLATFYLGIIALKNEEYSRSSYLFHKVLESQKRNLRIHAKWYLVLNYLKTNNFSKCRSLLIELINSHSIYKDAGDEIFIYISNK